MSKDLHTLNGQNNLTLWAGRITIDAIKDCCNLLCTSVHIPNFVRMRDSFAFSPLAKINDSPPSSWRRPSCLRQLGFYFRIPILAIKNTDTHLGIRIFWQRMRDSNPRKRSQSPVCYRYTNPLSQEHSLLYALFRKSQEVF